MPEFLPPWILSVWLTLNWTDSHVVLKVYCNNPNLKGNIISIFTNWALFQLFSFLQFSKTFLFPCFYIWPSIDFSWGTTFYLSAHQWFLEATDETCRDVHVSHPSFSVSKSISCLLYFLEMQYFNSSWLISFSKCLESTELTSWILPVIHAHWLT